MWCRTTPRRATWSAISPQRILWTWPSPTRCAAACRTRSRRPSSSVEGDAEDTERIVDDHAPVHSLKEARDRRALEQFSPEQPAEAPTEREDQPGASGEAEAPNAPSRKKNSRRSVPSWDEIMFGGKRD